jgi:hypothetical protein
MNDKLGGMAGRDVEQNQITDNNPSEPLIEGGMSSVGIVAGTIAQAECDRMKKLLFRVTKGLAVTHFEDFMQDDVPKSCYLVIFNNQNEADRIRVTKVCESFSGQGMRINIPDNMSELKPLIKDTIKNVEDSKRMHKISKHSLKKYLLSINYTMEKGDQ